MGQVEAKGGEGDAEAKGEEEAGEEAGIGAKKKSKLKKKKSKMKKKGASMSAWYYVPSLCRHQCVGGWLLPRD